jgi:hypothetical protein
VPWLAHWFICSSIHLFVQLLNTLFAVSGKQRHPVLTGMNSPYKLPLSQHTLAAVCSGQPAPSTLDARVMGRWVDGRSVNIPCVPHIQTFGDWGRKAVKRSNCDLLWPELEFWLCYFPAGECGQCLICITCMTTVPTSWIIRIQWDTVCNKKFSVCSVWLTESTQCLFPAVF